MERCGFGIEDACAEAVVEAADESVEEVALRRKAPVSCSAAPVVVSAGSGRGSEGGEGPEISGGGEALVLDAAVVDGAGLAAGSGDGRGAGVGLHGTSVGEPGAVIAKLAQHTCSGDVADGREAGHDAGVGMGSECLCRCFAEIVSALACCAELPKEGPKPAGPSPLPPTAVAASAVGERAALSATAPDMQWPGYVRRAARPSAPGRSPSHYGFTIDVLAAYRPTGKGRVERQCANARR